MRMEKNDHSFKGLIIGSHQFPVDLVNAKSQLGTMFTHLDLHDPKPLLSFGMFNFRGKAK